MKLTNFLKSFKELFSGFWRTPKTTSNYNSTARGKEKEESREDGEGEEEEES